MNIKEFLILNMNTILFAIFSIFIILVIIFLIKYISNRNPDAEQAESDTHQSISDKVLGEESDTQPPTSETVSGESETSQTNSSKCVPYSKAACEAAAIAEGKEFHVEPGWYIRGCNVRYANPNVVNWGKDGTDEENAAPLSKGPHGWSSSHYRPDLYDCIIDKS